MYPDSEKLVLENSQKLQEFFDDFEDYSPVTEKEKKKAHIAYEEFMKKS